MDKATVNIHEYIYVWTFLPSQHLEVGLLGHIVIFVFNKIGSWLTR